ncbi:glycoside hydrolase family 97 protein [Sphingobacterium litopenaei]|uniref:Glycoside hydrolase family 97 catalytic domain-containing protein n=1 Tax=Sphingobacterium litopenaei TaxID=2763500 RepID=A0ABR7Y9Y2_9SPHI|nr:glycoside hydrolase family 97 protein [Sphingobacterium litopenaei]MBD1428107.1 glycoside hydrolase family 97 catalytic domain-containing protein [Sphingobacterium litopenaei]
MYNLRFLFTLLILCNYAFVKAQVAIIESPDKQLRVDVHVDANKAFYTVIFQGKTILEKSPLGFKTNEGDFSSGITFEGSKSSVVEKQYAQDRIKVSNVNYKANSLTVSFSNTDKKSFAVTFQVSNNDIAFRYDLPTWKDTRSVVIHEENTGYKFPSTTTAFISTMMKPMTGFARTAVSYESGYSIDSPISAAKSQYGFVFPSLFKVGENGWALLSETGVTSAYCASHLSEISAEGIFYVAYPQQEHNNGFGSTGAALSLPGSTPWRTITVGKNLNPIVQTTIPFDVVDPLYAPSQNYKFGKSTWSWIVWQDQSMNWDDQVKYIDLASALNYPYILIDALWDTNIGRDRMEKLIQYANSKNVDVFLWYNSNGTFNDAPQGPRNRMHTAIARKQEMKWLQKIGVKGLKVDFFGGDKQETMRLYEDILSDANDHGLMIIFHGATLPRGWERLYPNYVGSEAVLASEMLIFSQYARDNEAIFATLHPFIRNAVGSMEFGGVFFNKFLTKDNKSRNKRLTTDAFQAATAILFQNPIQPFALTPNNLTDAEPFLIDFMKEVPTTWDETLYLDGYPGQYVILARRHKEKWYIAGVNAKKEVIKLKVNASMLKSKTLKLITDDQNNSPKHQDIKIDKNGQFEISIQPNGGFVIH